MYRRIFIAVIDTHRPVVLQFYLHHCLEDAILDLIRHVGTAHFIVEIVVDLARSLGIGRVVEVGLIAFHLAVESELGDYADISNRTIINITKKSYRKEPRPRYLGHSSSTVLPVNTETESAPLYSHLSIILIRPELGLEHLVHHLVRFLFSILLADACKHQ